MLAQAARNGFFFVLDRTNGSNLVSKGYVGVNWSQGLDEKGQPIPNPAKEPKVNGSLINTPAGGGTNWPAPSFNPETGLFYVNARKGYSIYFFKPEHGAYGWAGADYGLAGKGFLRAVHYRTGKIVWEHPYPRGSSSAGVLTTGTGLAITGDSTGNLLVLRASDGTSVWHENIGRMSSAPVTYELDGKNCSYPVATRCTRTLSRSRAREHPTGL